MLGKSHVVRGIAPGSGGFCPHLLSACLSYKGTCQAPETLRISSKRKRALRARGRETERETERGSKRDGERETERGSKRYRERETERGSKRYRERETERGSKRAKQQQGEPRDGSGVKFHVNYA